MLGPLPRIQVLKVEFGVSRLLGEVGDMGRFDDVGDNAAADPRGLEFEVGDGYEVALARFDGL